MIFFGYEYQNQSFGEIGARILFLKNDDVLYRFSGSGLLGITNGKFAMMPKIQGDILLNFDKNADLNHAYYFLLGMESTTKYYTPKVGISVFGLFDFTAGYSFQMPNQTLNDKTLKGFNFGINFNAPLVIFSKTTKK